MLFHIGARPVASDFLPSKVPQPVDSAGLNFWLRWFLVWVWGRGGRVVESSSLFSLEVKAAVAYPIRLPCCKRGRQIRECGSHLVFEMLAPKKRSLEINPRTVGLENFYRYKNGFRFETSTISPRTG